MTGVIICALIGLKDDLIGLSLYSFYGNKAKKAQRSTQQEQDFDGTNFALYNIYNETIIINRIKEQKDEDIFYAIKKCTGFKRYDC